MFSGSVFLPGPYWLLVIANAALPAARTPDNGEQGASFGLGKTNRGREINSVQNSTFSLI